MIELATSSVVRDKRRVKNAGIFRRAGRLMVWLAYDDGILAFRDERLMEEEFVDLGMTTLNDACFWLYGEMCGFISSLPRKKRMATRKFWNLR